MLPANETITGSKIVRDRVGGFDVRKYGAVGDGVVDDTTALTAAIDAARAAGGGSVYFPTGTYLTGPLTICASTEFVGDSRAASVIKLKAGANADLLTTDGFATFTGGTANGPQGFSLRRLTLDANRTQQTARARCFVAYGYNYVVDDVWFINGFGGGAYSEWGGNDNPMEALWHNVKVWNYGGVPGARGVDWNGPHDSKFVNTVIATLDSTIRPTDVAYGATPINGSTATFPGPGVPFTFVTTAAAPTGLYPEAGGSFVVPISNSLDTWTTVTYTGASTAGAVTTFTGCTASAASNRTATASKGIVVPTYGLAINMGSGTKGETALVVTSAHIWGRNHFALFNGAQGTFYASNCECEGAFIASVVAVSGSVYVGGSVYGTNGQIGQENEVGIQLGWHGRNCGHAIINTHVHNVGGSSSGHAGSAVFVSNSVGSNSIKVAGTTANPSRYVSPYSGSEDQWDARCQSNTAFSVQADYSTVIPQWKSGIKLGVQGTGARHFSGSGAPNIANSQTGDFYWRTDTPSVSLQRLYVATAVNTWTGVL